MKKTTNKEYALITGTTSGIGYAFCEKFASKKINLILVSRNEELVLKQKELLTQKHAIDVKYIILDLSEKNCVQKIMEYITGHNIQIDYLVNNAGYNEVGNFLKTDLEKELLMIQLHISFVTELTKSILPQMVSRRKGKIVNLGSTGSYIASPYHAVYTGTKAYTLFFSRALYAELRGTGVTVTCVCPGSTKTGFAKKAGIENTLLFKLFVLKPERVAKKGFRAMKKGKREIIVGFYSKIQVLTSKIMPKRFVDYLAKKMSANINS